MSIAYTLDPATGISPERRASSSLEPRTAASSRRNITTWMKVVLVSAVAATVAQALLSIHYENPSRKDGPCTFFVNPQNLPTRSYVSPVFGEEARHNSALPVLSVATGTNRFASTNCDYGLDNRNLRDQIYYLSKTGS